MPINKQALFRYRIIDDCFHKGPKYGWTNKELLQHVNSKLHEQGFEQISVRSLQADCKYLKEEKGAPIELNRKGYDQYKFYTDRNFTIQKSPLDDNDKLILQEATVLLKQFEGLPHFEAMSETIAQLQCWIDRDAAALILFEKNEYSGLHWIKPLYEAVGQHKEILIDYEPFVGNFEKRHLQPYMLKEFRNRWYVFGWEKSKEFFTSAALDRIKNVEILPSTFHLHADFDANTYFKDVIGVTVFKDAPTLKVVFRVHESSAKYLETKKLHQSQQRLHKDGKWTYFELFVKNNYELEAELRRFGAALEVLEPASLRAKFRAEVEQLYKQYQS